MRALRALVRLGPGKAMFYLRIWAALLWARFALWVLPWSALRGRIEDAVGRTDDQPHTQRRAVGEILEGYHAVRPYVPGNTCLVSALAVHSLLRSRGYGSRLVLGVATEGSGPLEAHAWVTYQGRIVVGDVPDLDRYVPLEAADRAGAS